MKVLIVDDEVYIREGLRTLIDWSEVGFDEVLEAKDAMEAMRIIEQSPPELILTDIFMPQISGLEFAKNVRSKYPFIRFIILTGYEKFEYAKEAIEIGVVKYLVKPIFPAELKETVAEIRNELEMERQSRNWSELMTRQLVEYKPIVVEKFWDDLLSGAVAAPDEIRKRAEMADIPLDESSYYGIAVEINQLENVFLLYGERNLPLVRFAIRNVLKELHADTLLHLLDYSDTILAGMMSGTPDRNEWQRSLDTVKKTLKIDVNLGIGNPCHSLSMVRQSFLEALDGVRYLSLIGHSGILDYREIPPREENQVAYPYREEKELLEMMQYRDHVNYQAVEDFVQNIIRQNSSPQAIRLAFLQFLGAVYRKAHEFGIDTVPPFLQSAMRLEQLSSNREIKQFICELLEDMIRRRGSLHASYVSQLVNQAKVMIEEHYNDPELSVTRIAQKLCISPNYLSRIFHQQTGMTCVEYMTKFRIEKAKKILLTTKYKNYEIAGMVGYANAHYFSFMFKRYTGCAPSEYRQQAESRFG
jgi:YesN/AraC family two-component response regulator